MSSLLPLFLDTVYLYSNCTEISGTLKNKCSVMFFLRCVISIMPLSVWKSKSSWHLLQSASSFPASCPLKAERIIISSPNEQAPQHRQDSRAPLIVVGWYERQGIEPARWLNEYESFPAISPGMDGCWECQKVCCLY